MCAGHDLNLYQLILNSLNLYLVNRNMRLRLSLRPTSPGINLLRDQFLLESCLLCRRCIQGGSVVHAIACILYNSIYEVQISSVELTVYIFDYVHLVRRQFNKSILLVYSTFYYCLSFSYFFLTRQLHLILELEWKQTDSLALAGFRMAIKTIGIFDFEG